MTVKGETSRNGKLQQYILLQGLAHYEPFQFTWFEVFCSSVKHSISSHTRQKKSVAHKYFQTIGVLIKCFHTQKSLASIQEIILFVEIPLKQKE